MARPPGGDDEIWVPITLHLPLGFAKAFNPTSCAPLELLVGPFSIIMLAQTANTVLVPVLPFLVKEVGEGVVAYGLLQSTLWTSQTVLAPLHGWLSDRCGRKPVIMITLLLSALGNAMLALASSIAMMMAARVVSGLGFQIALFRAYFADTAPREKRTGSFGLIGVVTSFSLFAGPAVGGFVSQFFGGGRSAAWLSCGLCVLGAMLCALWRPSEKPAPPLASSASASRLEGADLERYEETHKTVGGVKMVKIDLTATRADGASEGLESPSGATAASGACASLFACGACRCLRKTYRFARWLAGYDLYPLLTLNFFFRFAFAAYKSIFAFFCIEMLGYGTAQVGPAPARGARVARRPLARRSSPSPRPKKKKCRPLPLAPRRSVTRSPRWAWAACSCRACWCA